MKRRTFLLTATAATLAPALPANMAGRAATGFWVDYLKALHGSAPARTVATLAARPAAPATVAIARLAKPARADGRLARRLARSLFAEEESEAPAKETPA